MLLTAGRLWMSRDGYAGSSWSTKRGRPLARLRRRRYRPFSCQSFFFFQAEDGIRDKLVTGVQTCALPIFSRHATLNGKSLPASAFDGARLRLDGLAAENRLEVDATAEYMHDGTGLHRFRDPVDGRHYLHSQFESNDAHRVYACFDQPDLKATFELSVTAPENWVGGSNMTPSRLGGGDWRF